MAYDVRSTRKKMCSDAPSGSVMGIYARSDNTRGVHKAYANEMIRSCVGLEVQLGKTELLNWIS